METMTMQIHIKQLPTNTQDLKEMLHADVVQVLLDHGVQVTDVVTQFHTQQPSICVTQPHSNAPPLTPSSTSKANKKRTTPNSSTMVTRGSKRRLTYKVCGSV
jgi:hypothetical protein